MANPWASRAVRDDADVSARTSDRRISRGARFGIAVLLVLAGITVLWLLAKAAVTHMAFSACTENVRGATPSQCTCVANRMPDHVMRYEYFQRRFTGKKGISPEEMNDTWRSCNVNT